MEQDHTHRRWILHARRISRQDANVEQTDANVVTLSESASQLTEARKNIAGSIASIPPEEINAQPKAIVVEMLDGRLAGAQIVSDHSPGGGTFIGARSFGTSNRNDPLVVMDDGVPAFNGLTAVDGAT